MATPFSMAWSLIKDDSFDSRFILDRRSGTDPALPGENDQDREARAARDAAAETRAAAGRRHARLLAEHTASTALAREHARDADGGLTALNEDARNASRASSHAALVEAFERGHGQNHEDEAERFDAVEAMPTSPPRNASQLNDMHEWPPRDERNRIKPINQDAVEAVTAHLTGGGAMDEEPHMTGQDYHRLVREGRRMPQTNLNRFDANFPDYPDHPIHGKQNLSVNQRARIQRDASDMKDVREEANNNLIDNPPRLVRDEGGIQGNTNYRIKAGDKSVGNVMLNENREGGVRIGAGEVDADYQRQKLYARALQAIIAEHGSLTSYNRNNNSQPFHEQFNPPHAEKKTGDGRAVWDDGRAFPDDAHVKYTHQPQEPKPGWGSLTPDTGALPIHNERKPETMASTTVTGITKPPNYPGYANYGTRNKPMATSYPDWTTPEAANDIPPPGGWRNVGDTF